MWLQAFLGEYILTIYSRYKNYNLKSLKNLTPFNTLDTERHKAISQKGGLASRIKRIKKKILALQFSLIDFNSTDITKYNIKNSEIKNALGLRNSKHKPDLPDTIHYKLDIQTKKDLKNARLLYAYKEYLKNLVAEYNDIYNEHLTTDLL